MDHVSSFLKNVEFEHRAVIKFFTWKGLNAIKISKGLDNVYKDPAPSYRTVAKWIAEFMNPERGFEDTHQIDRSLIITDENIEAVERVVMRNRQVSVHRLAEELAIIHELMDNQLGIKKVCTRWILKLLTPVQRANRVNCYQELLHESEVNQDNFFDPIVTGDEFWIHHYDPLS